VYYFRSQIAWRLHAVFGKSRTPPQYGAKTKTVKEIGMAAWASRALEGGDWHMRSQLWVELGSIWNQIL